jgi:hypothetical protein
MTVSGGLAELIQNLLHNFLTVVRVGLDRHCVDCLSLLRCQPCLCPPPFSERGSVYPFEQILHEPS